MRLSFACKVAGDRETLELRAVAFLESYCGFKRVDATERSIRLVRGSRMRRMLSLQIERWPTELDLVFFGEDDAQTGVVLRYRVATGLHLVGSLEKAILEAEAAVLQEHLSTGRVRTVASVAGSSRRPVMVAVMLNAVMAVAVVAVIGLMAGYHPVAVGLVALAVGLLDGVTISAFADIMVDGARALPRVKDSVPSPSEVSAASSQES